MRLQVESTTASPLARERAASRPAASARGDPLAKLDRSAVVRDADEREPHERYNGAK